MKKKTIIGLIVLLMAFVIVPLAVVKPAYEGAEIFGGADGAAAELILAENPEYEPWFANLFEPASGEIESLLFALQAALGAGVIGYGMGYLKGKHQGEKD